MSRSLLLILSLLLLATGSGLAQQGLPAQLREVGIDQRLNEKIPLDLSFRDETGRPVELGEYFGHKPVILSLVYYECPMLCTTVLNGLLAGMRAMPLHLGEHFEVVTVSFNPRETPALAAAKKEEYVRHYGRPGTGRSWHFLTGDEPSIRRLADSVSPGSVG